MPKQTKSVEYLSPVEFASKQNQNLLRDKEKKAMIPDAVSGPIFKNYIEHFKHGSYQPEDLLTDLTRWLLGSEEETYNVILKNMQARYPDKPASIPGAVTNSGRRTAGTNYQSLVSYALARYLLETKSPWYVQQPVPKDLTTALAITFTAGISDASTEEAEQKAEEDLLGEKTEPTLELEGEQEEDIPKDAVVAPDVDILLKNASWKEESGETQPVVLLSVKTSLADRAGMAARWKTYFDLACSPCPHIDLGDCAYYKLGIKMENADKYDIRQAIVTANIYKYKFRDPRFHAGELNTGQTRSNTYMFDLKFTTRQDGIDKTPADWKYFQHFPKLLETVSKQRGLAF